jgi:hypothetical protein
MAYKSLMIDTVNGLSPQVTVCWAGFGVAHCGRRYSPTDATLKRLEDLANDPPPNMITRVGIYKEGVFVHLTRWS